MDAIRSRFRPIIASLSAAAVRGYRGDFPPRKRFRGGTRALMGVRTAYRRPYQPYPRRRRRRKLKARGKARLRKIWSKGKKNGNISRTYKILKIQPFTVKMDFDKTQHGSVFKQGLTANKSWLLWIGDKNENKHIYDISSGYNYFTTERITSKLQDFQVHRITQTQYNKVRSSSTDGFLEDKLTFIDPTVYFYRPNRRNWPTQFNNERSEDGFELAKKRCIRSCKDG